MGGGRVLGGVDAPGGAVLDVGVDHLVDEVLTPRVMWLELRSWLRIPMQKWCALVQIIQLPLIYTSLTQIMSSDFVTAEKKQSTHKLEFSPPCSRDVPNKGGNSRLSIDTVQFLNTPYIDNGQRSSVRMTRDAL